MPSLRFRARPTEPAELEAARRDRNRRRQTRARHADATRRLIGDEGRVRARALDQQRDRVYLSFEPGLALLVRAIRKPTLGTVLVAEYTGVSVRSRAGRVLVHRDPPAKRATRKKFGKRLRDRGLAWVPIGRTRPIDEARDARRDYGDQSVKFAPDIEDA